MKRMWLMLLLAVLWLDLEIYGPYSTTYLLYAVCKDTWHNFTWYFFGVW